jgi:hypothetical protein
MAMRIGRFFLELSSVPATASRLRKLGEAEKLTKASPDDLRKDLLVIGIISLLIS